MKKTLTKILIGTSLIGNLLFNSSCNYEKPQTKITQEKNSEFAKIDSINNYAYELRNKDPTKALSVLDSIQKVAEKIDYEKGHSGALVRKGNINQNLGNYELAKKDFSKFLEIKKEEKDSLGIADGLYSLGMVFAAQGNYNGAVKNYTNALKIYDKFSDSLFISQTCNGLGRVFDTQGKYDQALEYFDKSLDINKSLKDSLGVSLVLNNIGAIFDKQNKNEQALIFYFNSLKIANKINDEAQKAYCYNNISNVYRKEDNFGKALEYLQESAKINEKRKDKRNLALNLLSMGEIYLKNKDPTGAIEYLKKADNISKEIGNPSLQKDIYETFYQIYKEKKDFEKSLEYHTLFSQTKDSLLNEKSYKQVAELSTIYETEKKEKENESLRDKEQLQETKIEKQKMVNYGIGGIALLLLGVGSYLYRENKIKKKRNAVLKKQKKEITDSIRYASNIQASTLPSDTEIKRCLEEHFVFYKPKDIVSGDFYWIAEKNGKTYFSASDCTGHGVPGAFMHMTINAFLNGAINEKQIEKPDEIFNEVRNDIINSFKSVGEAGLQKDGMDSILCSWDKKSNALEFACANNPLYLIRDNKLEEIKGDKMCVGYGDELKPFKYNKIDLQKNDLIYILSDGYQDQIGGPKNKRFMRKNLKELLLSINQKPMPEQKEILAKTIENWMAHINPEDKKSYEQTDDLCVIGLRV
ncbi:MAG: tetratricopeptide repeat protein [Nanoarchaeota archaeon]|nr:tetratricopeptide repeat protein [Nanoarchaeota archaeon]